MQDSVGPRLEAASTARAARRVGSGFGPGLLAAALLFLAALAVYAPVRDHEFVNVDDSFYVYKNPMVLQGLTAEGLRWAFARFHSGNWHPLAWLSHMLDVQLFGMDAGSHHLTSSLLHALNAALLLWTLWRATAALGRSAFVAGLFALHPLRVESVAWVSERKDVLSGLFWILTILAYLRWARRPRPERYLAVCALFTLGLMSKPMLVTLPFVLLLLDFWPLGRLRPAPRPPSGDAARAARAGGGVSIPRLLLEKTPLLALSAVASVIAVFAHESGGAIGSMEKYPVTIRGANAVLSAVAYLRKTLWPHDLMMFYPHPGSGYSLPAALLALLVLALITLACLLALRSRPYLATGWLWYLGSLVPVIGAVQVGIQGMADRYTYLPGIGLAVAAAWGLSGASFLRRRRAGALAGAAAVLAILAILTVRQVGAWRDNESLYRRALAVDPDNHLALSVLGLVLTQQGRVEEGTELLARAYRSSPTLAAGVHLDAGDRLAMDGKRAAALNHYRTALALDPGNENARVAVARLQRWAPGAGLPPSPPPAVSSPENEAASWFRSANAFAGEGDCLRAVELYREALRIRPDLADAWNNLGSCYGRLGRHREAAEAFEKAVAADPSNAGARTNLEQARRALGR